MTFGQVLLLHAVNMNARHYVYIHYFLLHGYKRFYKLLLTERSNKNTKNIKLRISLSTDAKGFRHISFVYH